jgi:hypothetical protein
VFPKLTHIQYILLLNDKEFCFSLIGLNSIFSTLPRSEYTSREVYSGLSIFVYCLFGVLGYNCFIIFQDYLNIKILKYDENFEILWNFWVLKFYKFWNLYKIYKNLWNFLKILNFKKKMFSNFRKIPYYLIKQLLTFNFSQLMTIRTWLMID